MKDDYTHKQLQDVFKAANLPGHEFVNLYDRLQTKYGKRSFYTLFQIQQAAADIFNVGYASMIVRRCIEHR